LNQTQPLIVFELESARYALPISVVERVVRAVEVTPLPRAPEVVRGVIDLAGRVIPVVDARRRLRLPTREVRPADQMIIARTSRRSMALLVDRVEGVIECEAGDLVAASEIAPGLDFVAGVLKLPDGPALIHDLDRFLSLEEEAALEGALET
jgi:purine-binding chemotaxis protein CheW